MSDPQEIERDLREYLEKEKNLRGQAKLEYLRVLFDKHLKIRKLDHMITKNDLFGILSDAKREYTNLPLPLYMSGRKIDSSELPAIAMIQALVSYLSRNHLLNRLPRIDFTDESGEFETVEE